MRDSGWGVVGGDCVLRSSVNGEKLEVKVPEGQDHTEAMERMLQFLQQNVSAGFARETVAVGYGAAAVSNPMACGCCTQTRSWQLGCMS